MMRDTEPRHEPEPNDRQRKFIEGLALNLSAPDAAKRAGYSDAYARKASRLLKQPMIAKAVEAIRAEARTVAAYSLLEAVKEIDKAVLFAYGQKNAMAIAKLLEAKGRLFGLYVERVQVETVDLKGALLEARSRVIDVRSLMPGHMLALASATPTTGASSADSTANSERKWKPFSE